MEFSLIFPDFFTYSFIASRLHTFLFIILSIFKFLAVFCVSSNVQFYWFVNADDAVYNSRCQQYLLMQQNIQNFNTESTFKRLPTHKNIRLEIKSRSDTPRNIFNVFVNSFLSYTHENNFSVFLSEASVLSSLFS